MPSSNNSIIASLWPTDSCNTSQFTAKPVLINEGNARVCGLQSTNDSLLSACCNGARTQTYQCWTFCEYSGAIRDFAECIADRTNSTSIARDAYCQGDVVGAYNRSVSDDGDTSSGFRSYSTPRLSWVALALLFTLFFISPASAASIASLDNGLTRRQSDNATNCKFHVLESFPRSSQDGSKVSSDLNCAVEACYQDIEVDLGWHNANRTLDGNSAAEPQYDQFFEIIGNATNGRVFPALSNLKMNFSYVAPEGGSFVQFYPFQFCVNGTATGCGGVYGDTNDTQQVTACGPLYVSDADPATEDETATTLQGTLSIVQNA